MELEMQRKFVALNNDYRRQEVELEKLLGTKTLGWYLDSCLVENEERDALIREKLGPRAKLLDEFRATRATLDTMLAADER